MCHTTDLPFCEDEGNSLGANLIFSVWICFAGLMCISKFADKQLNVTDRVGRAGGRGQMCTSQHSHVLCYPIVRINVGTTDIFSMFSQHYSYDLVRCRHKHHYVLAYTTSFGWHKQGWWCPCNSWKISIILSPQAWLEIVPMSPCSHWLGTSH